jgi:hypothetical protein
VNLTNEAVPKRVSSSLTGPYSSRLPRCVDAALKKARLWREFSSGPPPRRTGADRVRLLSAGAPLLTISSASKGAAASMSPAALRAPPAVECRHHADRADPRNVGGEKQQTGGEGLSASTRAARAWARPLPVWLTVGQPGASEEGWCRGYDERTWRSKRGRRNRPSGRPLPRSGHFRPVGAAPVPCGARRSIPAPSARSCA